MLVDNDHLQQLMQVIDRLSRDRGYPPTVREIGVFMGVASPSTVHKAIKILKRRGLAISDDRIPRSLRLTDSGKEFLPNE